VGWWNRQLGALLGAIARAGGIADARRAALEVSADALEADFGAMVAREALTASHGFAGEPPREALVRAAAPGFASPTLPGEGRVHTLTVPLVHGSLILGRRDGRDFTPGDAQMLSALASLVDLVLPLERRRNLLEQLSSVQEAITSQAPLQEVFETIAEAAGRLLDAELVAVRVIDSDDPSRMSTPAVIGHSPQMVEALRYGRVTTGATAAAPERGKLVVIDDYQHAAGARQEAIDEGVTTSMAVPLHEHGTVIGSLVVSSRAPGRRFNGPDQEMLAAFAEHASLALAAARTGDTLRQALTDPLTGLANRVLFLDRLDHALARAARSGATVGVLFVDLDRFKMVNDSLGHSAGDQLLVAAAGRIRSCLRRADTAARLGGDEFALLLEDASDEADAAHAAERVIEALRAPFTINEREIFVSASVGIALGTVEEPETVLRNADVAMYRAKSRGKDRYELFAPEMQAEVVDRLTLEAELRHAVERGELELHFQPVWRLDGSGAVGVEALVRWRHPERGLLTPGMFIPLAEESGLILDIGRWVLAEACRRGAEWQSVAPGVQVAVNLSGWQLEQPDIVEEVAAALERSGLPQHTLVLELTETILMHDTEATIAKLRALKDLGARLAIDDFGTGYSSLRYLQRFPIDVLKIPKPFVDELAGEVETGVLARAILDLSRHLGLRTVAEGIETAEQLERLRALGCPFGQGFLLAKPMPFGKLIELFSSARAPLTS
jgi:diguanylate cyclase (GGDEF)-like protein